VIGKSGGVGVITVKGGGEIEKDGEELGED
jgi:hypothetical protein